MENQILENQFNKKRNFLTVREASIQYNVSTVSIRNWIASGLQTYMMKPENGYHLVAHVAVAEVDQWLKDREQRYVKDKGPGRPPIEAAKGNYIQEYLNNSPEKYFKKEQKERFMRYVLNGDTHNVIAMLLAGHDHKEHSEDCLIAAINNGDYMMIKALVNNGIPVSTAAMETAVFNDDNKIISLLDTHYDDSDFPKIKKRILKG